MFHCMRIALGAAVVVSAGAVWTLAFLGLDGWPLLMFVGGTLVVIVATTLDELAARTPPTSDEATTDGPPWRVQLARQIAAANGLIAKGYMEPDDDFEIGTREHRAPLTDEERERTFQAWNGVNDRPFFGAAPGTLVLETISITTGGFDRIGHHEYRTTSAEVVRRFRYRPGRDWNSIPTPEGGALVLKDAEDRTMHPCMDFDAL